MIIRKEIKNLVKFSLSRMNIACYLQETKYYINF